MRALTVQQPWAWAIIHGGKDIENRTQLWKYRGPLAIHAGARLSERGCELVPDLLDQADQPDLLAQYAATELVYGAIIGTVQLVDVHPAQGYWTRDNEWRLGCCDDTPWAETGYTEHGGRQRRDITHLVLEDPRPVDPIPCKGRLGLWTPDQDILEQLR